MAVVEKEHRGTSLQPVCCVERRKKEDGFSSCE
jgi:hypothetical protein